jgi:hypothetical protein
MNAPPQNRNLKSLSKPFGFFTKTAFAALSIMSMFLLNSCFLEKTYKPFYTEDGDGKLPLKSYTFTKTMSAEDGKIIDTTALYLQIFDIWSSNAEERSNPKIMKFEQNGFFKEDSFKSYQKFSKIRTHQSVHYGGRFYLEGNNLFTEEFYPNGQVSQRYVRTKNTGIIKGDTIFMVYYQHKSTFVKKSFNDIFEPKK